jgi:hypothetical protein
MTAQQTHPTTSPAAIRGGLEHLHLAGGSHRSRSRAPRQAGLARSIMSATWPTLVFVVLAILAVALVATTGGCASAGLADNQANHTNTFGKQRTVPLTIDQGPDLPPIPLQRVTVEHNSEGEPHRTITEPVLGVEVDPTTFDGPLGKNAFRWSERGGMESYHEGHTYALETSLGYSLTSTPADALEVDMGTPRPADDGDGFATSVRGTFTGDYTVRDTDGDGRPDELVASKSDVVSASAQVFAALDEQRKALLQVVGQAEGQRVEAIEAVQLEAIKQMGGGFSEAMRAVQAIARPGVGVSLDHDLPTPDVPVPDVPDADDVIDDAAEAVEAATNGGGE